MSCRCPGVLPDQVKFIHFVWLDPYKSAVSQQGRHIEASTPPDHFVTVVSTSTLTKVKFSDSGTYCCIISRFGKRKETVKKYINVKVVPVVMTEIVTAEHEISSREIPWNTQVGLVTETSVTKRPVSTDKGKLIQ